MVREPLTRILVPLDFSIVSEPLLEYAVRLASKYSSELLLVHVIEESVIEHVAAGYDVSSFVEELEERALVKLRQYADYAAGKEVNARVYENMIVGDPAAIISHVASEEGVSEVLIASKGWGLKRLVPLGSTARLLAALSPVPVVRVKAVKEEDKARIMGDPDNMFNHIIVGLDENYSKRFIDYLTSLALKAGSSLTVVHVMESGSSEGLDFVDKAIEGMRSANVNVSRIIVSGKPYKRIIEVAGQLEATAIAVERRVRSHIFRELFLGSTLVNLLNKTEKPVIVVPSEAERRTT